MHTRCAKTRERFAEYIKKIEGIHKNQNNYLQNIPYYIHTMKKKDIFDGALQQDRAHA